MIRVRVPEPAVAESQRAIGALPGVQDVSMNGGPAGWLRIRVGEPPAGDQRNHNDILDALIRAGIPILSYEPEGGRLQDVFLQLTGRGAR